MLRRVPILAVLVALLAGCVSNTGSSGATHTLGESERRVDQINSGGSRAGNW